MLLSSYETLCQSEDPNSTQFQPMEGRKRENSWKQKEGAYQANKKTHRLCC